MDAQEFRNLQEAYNQVYAQVDESLSAQTNRMPSGTSVQSSSSSSSSGSTVLKRNTGASGGVLGSLDKFARDTAGKVGETIGRNRGQQTGIPGAGTVGGVLGSQQGKQTYDNLKDKAGKVLGGFLKQDYEPNNFDFILEYLVAEGYADTNKAAIAIMANMSEEWRQSIVEKLSLPGLVASVFNQSTASGSVPVGKDRYGQEIKMEKIANKKPGLKQEEFVSENGINTTGPAKRDPKTGDMVSPTNKPGTTVRVKKNAPYVDFSGPGGVF